jgi:hypothetical protein
MDAADRKVDVPVRMAKAWNIETTEDKNTALIFEFFDGNIEGIVVPEEFYSAFATRILKETQKFAKVGVVKPTGSETVQVDPIQVPSIGVGKGRTESEAILAIDVGNLKLAFAVDLSVLAGICMGLSKMTRIAPDQSKN